MTDCLLEFCGVAEIFIHIIWLNKSKHKIPSTQPDFQHFFPSAIDLLSSKRRYVVVVVLVGQLLCSAHLIYVGKITTQKKD